MTRPLATLPLFLALIACGPQGAWQPTISPAPGFEHGIPRDAFSDGCWVEWDSLLIGIVSGTLLDSEQLATASLPSNQAVELRGSSGITLAQLHIPAATSPSSLHLRLGPPATVVSSPYEGPCPMGSCGDDGEGMPDNPVRGNASPEQRAVLRDADIAGRISGRLYCGKGTELAFQWDLDGAEISCAIDQWDLAPADSTTTWVDFAFHQLFASSPVEAGEDLELHGRPWLKADLDGNGVLSAEELATVSAETIGLPSPSTLDAWIAARSQELTSLAEGSPCSWTEDEP
ncbi:MAG TPA: hypothetical protein DIU15_20150 [Deltaproteobacteria bacterium]|nr:hypothetical protein [Deltaproteobacteria bacterium]HCP48361.1 hypothetical protein [Deltaproteobacteria bacterium]